MGILSKTKYPSLRTKDIDCAAYLVTNGHVCIPRREGQNHATFTFKGSADVFELQEEFMKGKAIGNLAHYMYTRVVLKRAASYEPFILTKSPIAKIVRIGMQYFFVENGMVHSNMYGDTDVHNRRLNSGNFYLNKWEADATLNQ